MRQPVSSWWLAWNLLEEVDPPYPVCFFSKSHSSLPGWLNTDWMGSRGGSWSKFSIKLVSSCLWIWSPTGAEPPPSAFGQRPQFDFLGVVAVPIYVLFEQIGGATSHLHSPFCGSKLGIVIQSFFKFHHHHLSGSIWMETWVIMWMKEMSRVWLIGEQGRFPVSLGLLERKLCQSDWRSSFSLSSRENQTNTFCKSLIFSYLIRFSVTSPFVAGNNIPYWVLERLFPFFILEFPLVIMERKHARVLFSINFINTVQRAVGSQASANFI